MKERERQLRSDTLTHAHLPLGQEKKGISGITSLPLKEPRY